MSGDPAARRRREQVFGEVLPESTADDREADAESAGGAAGAESRSDAWLRENVPPHHG